MSEHRTDKRDAISWRAVHNVSGQWASMYRAEVPGGWLYWFDSCLQTFTPDGAPVENWSSSIAFVPRAADQ